MVLVIIIISESMDEVVVAFERAYSIVIKANEGTTATLVMKEGGLCK